MKRLLVSFTLLFINIFFVLGAFADQKEAIKGPIIKGYGPVFAIKNSSVALPENFVYKTVFSISKSGSSPEQLNRSIESVARYINMHGINGVLIENMDLAIVIRGHAAKDLLNNKTYSDKYLFDNPNTEMIEKLRAVGVKFYICGQSVRFGGYHKKDLEHPEDLALSAMTMLTILQQQNYQLIPL